MKLKLKDKVVVIRGRDKGKTGEVVSVLPRENMVVVENVNVVKRHVKPGGKHPKGGIIEMTKPIEVSRLMVLDPTSGLPARVGYKISQDGHKERVFKVSTQRQKKAPVKPKTPSKDKQ